MNKDKINKERKEKAKKVIFKILHGVSYALSTCFIATCIVACASNGAKNKSNNSPKSLIQYRIEGESELQSESESVSYPIYDDSNYQITLSAYQLNNYHWDNLYNTFRENFDGSELSESVIQYINSTLDLISFDLSTTDGLLSYANNIDSYVIDFYLDTEDTNTIHKFILNESDTNQFTNNIIWKLYDSDSYPFIKQAIQLDIQVNESPQNPTSDIFTSISDTISNFIITLNSGITAIVALFWNSTSSSLTPLGILTTIVVGVALAYFLFRLLSGLIRLRG